GTAGSPASESAPSSQARLSSSNRTALSGPCGRPSPRARSSRPRTHHNDIEIYCARAWERRAGGDLSPLPHNRHSPNPHPDNGKLKKTIACADRARYRNVALIEAKDRGSADFSPREVRDTPLICIQTI